MQTTFDIEIFAIAVGVEGNCGGVGQISHHLEIITETDILYLPVVACIFFKQIILPKEMLHIDVNLHNLRNLSNSL